jgi:hypothetical protein
MFGQREHIMLIAAVPYLLLSGLRADGGPSSRGLGFAIALCAGIGFALKPHFMIMPALIESYLIHRHGWSRQLRDIVPWTIGLVAVAHAIFAVLVTPEYFTFVLPLVLRYYTELGDVEMIGMLLGSVLAPTILALVPLSAAALFMLRSRLGVVLALFAIGTVASAALQAKGWSYHSLPALSATLLLAAVVIGGVLDRYLPLEKINQPMPIAVITASLMMLVFYQSALFNPPFRNQRGFEDSVAVRLEHVIEQYADNKRILVLSPGIYPHFPVFNYTGARNAMRFESLWLLQGIYADCEEFAPLYNPIESMSIAEQFVFRAVAEDFARVRPSLVIIDRVAGIPRCQARAFDYLEYFQRNPLFAKTFQAYTPLMDLERYTIYWRG